MAEQKQPKVSAQMRAAMFNSATRKYEQTLSKEIATMPLSNVRFTLPKARYLSSILLQVKSTINVKGTAGKMNGLPEHTPYNILKRLTVSLNNGFDPFAISGQGLYFMNLINLNGDLTKPEIGGALCDFDGFTASTEGTDNTYTFFIEVPLTMNRNVNTGLILLQNNESMVDLSLDIASNTDIFTKEGYTAEIKRVEIQPCLTTFSVPSAPEARPDISVLKLVQERSMTLDNTGENIIKMPVGTIYRKIVLYLTDADGKPVEDADLNGNFQIVFNQADSPVQISAEMLRAKNAMTLGFPVPKGVYIFDFSSQALPNLGGSRDFIDTERMQEFWLKIVSSKSIKAKVITENLTRLM